MPNIYPFIQKPCDLKKLERAKAYQALMLLETKKGYKNLTKKEKEFVTSIFDELWNYDTYKYGIYKVGGWIIDFTDFLNSYLVKFKYHGWQEIKAFNKTCIRKNAVNPSYVLEIIER